MAWDGREDYRLGLVKQIENKIEPARFNNKNNFGYRATGNILL